MSNIRVCHIIKPTGFLWEDDADEAVLSDRRKLILEFVTADRKSFCYTGDPSEDSLVLTIMIESIVN